MFSQVPEKILIIVKTLEDAGFQAYLVGGCLRNLIRSQKPKDWDIATSASPENIISLFPKTFYENNFGTVGVIDEWETDETLKKIEITPFRIEKDYQDKRHPEMIEWAKTIEEDLARRDFTMNAIAYQPIKDKLIDPHGGIKDIKDMIISCVGVPDERLSEDPLRILRAIRFSAELGFSIEKETFLAIQKNSDLLKHVSRERIRDEFSKIILSDHPRDALILSHNLGILKEFLPELEDGIDISQNQAHKYDVWDHNLRTLQHAVDKKWPFHVRLASLFHDISKPETREWSKDKKDYTFHGHDLVGAKKTRKIMQRLKFPVKLTENVVALVRWHMFFSDTEKITLSAVRRLVANIGEENIWDLMNLRVCDRIGTGRPKENPYRLRKYKAMVEEVIRDPISLKMLKIDGKRLMEVTHETPGPKIGFVLHALLEEILEDPTLNNVDYLEKKALSLMKLDEKTLKNLGEKAKITKESADNLKINEIKRKYNVS